ncbi:hypothetical protein BDW22DRAFT_1431324 [Trametopsis cervina]|nr:hypothetical protein BDW22DRAFT_1431324 [Trametopsis cervina]
MGLASMKRDHQRASTADRNMKAASSRQDLPKVHQLHEQHYVELFKAERNKQRAEDHCFNCSEVGHKSRNCPDHKKAKVPKMLMSSVNFKRLEKMADEARRASVQVAAVSVSSNDSSAATEVPDNGWETHP